MKIKSVLFIAIILLFISDKCKAVSVHFVTEHLPPFQIVEDNKLASGAMLELIEALIDYTQIDATLTSYPWARAYALALQQPNTFIFSMQRISSREPLFHWVGHLYTLKTQVAILSKRLDIKLDRKEDISNYTIGAVNGGFEALLLNSLGADRKIYLATSYKQLWQMLDRGRLDSIMTNPYTSKLMMKALGMNDNEVVFPMEFNVDENRLFLAANKRTDPIIIEKLRKGLIDLKDNGTYQQILKKWQLN